MTTDLGEFADNLAVRVIAERLVRLINDQALDGVGRTDAPAQVVADDLRRQVEDTAVSPRTTTLRRLHCTWIITHTPV